MPIDSSIRKVMVIGSGPIVIGQAAEFDYSGTQACRVLREEGIRVILINSNPATIMTDPDIADRTYIEPLNVERLEQIIALERPDALLPNLGGQSGLNLSSELAEAGILDKYGVKVIGVQIDAIKRGEDREEFKNTMAELGIEMARSRVSHTVEEAVEIAEELGYPCVLRPAYTMGGTGGGLVYNIDELKTTVARGLTASPVTEVLVEESVLGWEELEFEVVRDAKGQLITVCTIENIDPMGVHTGDSFCAAPMQTISQEVIDRLQKKSYAIVDKVGVIGGTNVQWAHDPVSDRDIIIEINPRTSRSSALASKATGFPIALVSAMLASGMTLDEIPCGKYGTLDQYYPDGDYVVVKFARWAFEKFKGVSDHLGTQMRAVGEVMSIGKTYKEAFQKAIRSLEKNIYGLGFVKDYNEKTLDELLALLHFATPDRQFQMYEALRKGATVEQLHELTKIKAYFIEQMKELVDAEERIIAWSAEHPAQMLPADELASAKRDGFADRYLAQLLHLPETQVREARLDAGIKQAWEGVHVSSTADSEYFYSTYNAPDKSEPAPGKKVMILGGGPNRIGQGIEFDYTCVHAVQELGKNYDTIMVNCNPETVSTDYDMSDRLYFEPLTFEDVLEIYEAEKKMGPIKGVIVQLGGQTPLSLAARLKAAGVPILGTTPESIDLAENRELFGEVLKKADMNAPRYGTALSLDEAREAAHAIGYPVLVRPSYVLGGRGMEIVYDDAQLRKYVDRALKEAQADTVVSGRLPSPLLIDKFLQDAVEIDVDALFDGEELYIGGIMEHVEEAGVHSGDAACTLPPSTLSDDQIRRLREGTYAIAKGCGVQGLINVQYAFMANTLYVIEANPRASRTVPFASKATGVALAKAAARIMVGETIQQQRDNGLLLPHGDGGDIHRGQQVAVKESVLPFKRFRTPLGKTVDVLLGPEMRSTGEVMGFDRDFPHAFAKSQLAAYEGGLPTSGNVFISVNDTDKRQLPLFAARLVELGFNIWATEGTASVLRRYGIDSKIVDKISVRMDSDPDDPITTYHAEGSVGKNVVQLIEEGAIDLILNTPNSRGSRSDGYAIRSAAIAADLPQFTTMTEFSAVLMAIEAVRNNDYQIMSIQDHSTQLFELESRD